MVFSTQWDNLKRKYFINLPTCTLIDTCSLANTTTGKLHELVQDFYLFLIIWDLELISAKEQPDFP